MAAPALAASSADWAICAGVTGTAGLRPGVSADPVTAHEIMTLRCMAPPSRCPARARDRTLGERGTQAESVRGAQARGPDPHGREPAARPVLPPIVHCAKAPLGSSLERIR